MPTSDVEPEELERLHNLLDYVGYELDPSILIGGGQRTSASAATSAELSI
ncbi:MULTISPECIES: hypothetical protein [Bacteria]